MTFNKQKVIIHIGLHKTATTFLQCEVFPKIKDTYLIRNFNFTTTLPDNEKTIIISNEQLSGGLNLSTTANGRYEIAKKLSKIYPNAKIIIAFRDKHTWIKSCWKQYIVEGGILNFNTYKTKINYDLLNFEKYESELKHLFKDVFVYHYEDFNINKKQIITDMCKFMGVKEPEWKDLIYRKSLSDNQIKVLRIINYINPERYRIRFTSIIKAIRNTWTGEKRR